MFSIYLVCTGTWGNFLHYVSLHTHEDTVPSMNPCWDIQQSDTVAQVAGQYTGVVSRTQLQKHV